ncbi:UNVERIFIED_ORG: cation diffusion facilitator CzcD-associated flavoprotein CzcO [Burkholderia sp. 1263]
MGSASASAFDNAATALEAGAAQVDLFVRRDALPRVNTLTGIAGSSFLPISPGAMPGRPHR